MAPIQKILTPSRPEPVREGVDQDCPSSAQMVTTRRREKAALIKVASTVSSSSGVAVPLELPNPWLSSGRIASTAAMPATARPAGSSGASQAAHLRHIAMPPTACTCRAVKWSGGGELEQAWRRTKTTDDYKRIESR